MLLGLLEYFGGYFEGGVLFRGALSFFETGFQLGEILIGCGAGCPDWTPFGEEVLQVAAFGSHNRVEGCVSVLFGCVGADDFT